MPTDAQDMRRVFPAGTTIFREGETGACAYIIERGSVEISTNKGGEHIILAHRKTGEIFGEMAIVDDKPRSATVTAETDCYVLVVSKDLLQNRLQALDPVMRMMIGVILERFRDSVRQMSGAADEPQKAITNHALAPVDDYLFAIERIELEQSVKQALLQDQLELFYQPIVSAETGHVAGFEGLARWRHPERGILSPGAFIAAAEDSGLVRDISRWALRRACIDAKRLSEATPEPLFVSVNVTGEDICDTDFLEVVRDTLMETGVEPGLIELEITESTLVQKPEVAIAMLEKFRALGLSISVDDFGTGYSNLRYLTRYPINKLKIDKSFVDTVLEQEKDSEVVRAMVQLGHTLKLKVVAEGVEEEKQWKALRALKCDLLQGFFFARPMPFEECELLRQRQNATTSAIA